MNGKKIHSTNDSVGGVDFFAVDERVYMNVHEQWHGDVEERSLKCIWWTIAHKKKNFQTHFMLLLMKEKY